MSAATQPIGAPAAAAPARPAVTVAPVAVADEALASDVAAALERDGIPARVITTTAGTLARRLAAEGVDLLVLVGHIDRPATAQVLRGLHRGASSTHVVVASPEAGNHGPRRALNLGADGFVVLTSPAALTATVMAVHAGQVCIPRLDRRTIAKPSFSHREKEILALVTLGSTNQEIAARLFLTESTVKSHLATAFEKLGVRSRTEAATLLLDPDEGLQATALPSRESTAPFVLHPGGAR